MGAELLFAHPLVRSTNIYAFQQYVNRQFGLSIRTRDELQQWSTEKLEDFNQAVWTFCGIIHSRAPTAVASSLDKMWPPPTWYEPVTRVLDRALVVDCVAGTALTVLCVLS